MTAEYTIRPVRAGEWREAKALRLQALADEVAAMAFLESHADAAARPDEFWRERTRNASLDAGPDARVRQFVAVAGDGTWVGTATLVVERAGDEDFTGTVLGQDGGLVVSVYVAPEHRGRVLASLFHAATGWAQERGLPRARLHVHVNNARARRAYEKAGFRDTGGRITTVAGRELEMAITLGSIDRGRR